jgi:hypothetical protein
MRIQKESQHVENVALVFGALIVGLMLASTTRADHFRMERSIVINAPAEKNSPWSMTSASSRPGRRGRKKMQP